MRISVSLLLAIAVSFSLLLMMAGLVNQPEVFSQRPTRVSDSMSMPAAITPHEPSTHRKLPEQSKIIAVPRGLPATETETDGPTIMRGVPDGDPKVTDKNWLPPGTWDITPTGREDHQPSGSKGLIPISQIQPLYPREQAMKGVEGWVTLRFDVRQDGSVGNVNVINAQPRGAFDQAARLAVQRWRYQPTEQGPVVQTVTLDFRLEH